MNEWFVPHCRRILTRTLLRLLPQANHLQAGQLPITAHQHLWLHTRVHLRRSLHRPQRKQRVHCVDAIATAWLPVTTLLQCMVLYNQEILHNVYPRIYFLSLSSASVIYNCLLVSTAVAPGINTIVCVLSMIIAGPSIVSPSFSDVSRNTGVSSTRPTPSK